MAPALKYALKAAGFAAVVAVLWVVNGMLTRLQVQGQLNGYYLQIVIFAGINVILAVSLNLINGFTGQFSLGHAGFMAIGAYAAGYLTTILKVPAPWFPVALVAGGLAAAAAGLVVGLPTLRLRGDYLAIATLGMAEIIRVLFLNVEFGGGAKGLMVGLPRYADFFWVALWAVITVVVLRNFIRSSHGRACLSVREDEMAAQVMGVNITFYKVTAFVLGAFFAGVAGGLYGHYLQTLTPNKFDMMLSIEIVVMVVVGGMRSTAGPVMAAVILTWLLEYLRNIPEWVSGWHAPGFLGNVIENIQASPGAVRMIIYSLLLIVAMIAGHLGKSRGGWRAGFGKKGAPPPAAAPTEAS